MVDEGEWLISIDHEGRKRFFDASDLPIAIGSGDADDIRLADVQGSVQISMLDGVFFVQAAKGTRNVRFDGKPLHGTQRLASDAEIAVDSARLHCTISDGRLTVSVFAQLTAGDTAPPDLEDLARTEQDRIDELAIQPVAFRPGAAASEAAQSYRPSPTTVIAGLAFLILAILGWFAFTAKSVAIVTVPAAEQINLPSTLFKFRVAERYLLRSGRHRVTATAEGFYPLDTEIDVGASPDQRVELELEKLPGLITITTDPPAGVSVALDGSVIGVAPLRDVEIPAGPHVLEFSLDRHFGETVEIDVRGTQIKQAVSATLLPNWAPVAVESRPVGAQVLIDGEPVGVSPVELELEQGEYDLELRLRGHNAWRRRIEVVANEPLAVPRVSLELADGRVTLVSIPAEAAVSVNGEFAGRTPLELRLRPGLTHDVVLTKPGFETANTELTVGADSGRTVEIELTAQFGDVDVASEPAGAEIWVDEALAGTTPARLRLMSLPHSIEVRLEGHAPVVTDLTPRPGIEHVLSFDLEPLDDLSGSGYPRFVETSLGQRLRILPAGEFTMGSSRREIGRRSNEVLRPVRISKAFYIGVNEVTNGEFREFLPDHDSGEFGGQSLNGDDQPVVNVTWSEAAQYLNWLSIRDGLQPVYQETNAGWVPVRPLRNGYRLPTEAEWAWAARFVGREEASIYPWGNDVPPPDRSGNYADLTAAKTLPTTLQTYNDSFIVTAPAGSFEDDEFGLYDLAGNVSEWVQDVYSLAILESQEVEVDPLGPLSGEYHVVRGASWRSASTADLRLASRNYSSGSRDDVGFRIARNLD